MKEIKDQEIWENFLLEIKEKTFLQSWNWGEFQKKMGEKIWRLGMYRQTTDNSQLTTNKNRRIISCHSSVVGSKVIAVALVIKVTAKRGKFLFVPHGPLTNTQHSTLKTKILIELVQKLKEIAWKERVIFIRIAPLWERNEENIRIFKDLGFREAPIHIHPEVTWQLDITTGESEVLKNMRKTTRNLIKRAQKEGVKIYFSKNVKDVKLFYELYEKTVKRHRFIPFSYSFLEKEFESFLPDNVLLTFAKWQGQFLSGAMIIFWQGTAFYHQGASLNSFPKIPASYLLQWEAIREAKKRGCTLYNFWGIAPIEDLKHPWYGLTLFKKGFGGEKREYVRTQDLPLSYLYFKNWIIEIFRKSKRKL